MGALAVWVIITYLGLCVAGEWDREGGLATMPSQAAGPSEPRVLLPILEPHPHSCLRHSLVCSVVAA